MSSNTAAGAASSEQLDQLRSERALRPPTKEEEGTSIFHLPDGLFGFTYAPGLKEVPVYAKRHYHGFEVHRLANAEIHLVGFVTPDEKAKLTGAKEAVQLVIFPDPWEQSTELISVSQTRLQPAKKAVSREDGNPFRTLVFPG